MASGKILCVTCTANIIQVREKTFTNKKESRELVWMFNGLVGGVHLEVDGVCDWPRGVVEVGRHPALPHVLQIAAAPRGVGVLGAVAVGEAGQQAFRHPAQLCLGA